LFNVELVDARLQIFQLASAVGLQHRVTQQLLHHFFEQVIGAEAIFCHDIVHHEISELFDVPGMMDKNIVSLASPGRRLRVASRSTFDAKTSAV
jgi:hypothetical protein